MRASSTSLPLTHGKRVLNSNSHYPLLRGCGGYLKYMFVPITDTGFGLDMESMMCVMHREHNIYSFSNLTCTQRKRLHHSTSSKPHSNCRSLHLLFHYRRIFPQILLLHSTRWMSPVMFYCARGSPVQCSTTHLRPGAGSTC